LTSETGVKSQGSQGGINSEVALGKLSFLYFDLTLPLFIGTYSTLVCGIGPVGTLPQSRCFLFYFLPRPLLPNHCRCGGLLLHLITHTDARKHTHTHTQTFGMTPLEEGSAHRRDLYLKAHKTLKSPTSMTRRDSKQQFQQFDSGVLARE